MELVAYCRVSEDRAGQSLAVSRQEKDIRQWAEAKGHTISRVISDNDISAYSGKPRPGFEELLKQPNKNVVVWGQDRLLRVSTDLERVLDAELAIYQVTAGILDLATPQGRMQARVHASMATYEVEQMKARQLAKNQQLAEQGKYRGSIRPFGQERTGAWVDSEATAVRKAVAMLLHPEDTSRWSFYRISEYWNDLGLRTPQTGEQGGKQWTAGTVRQYFQRPRLYGFQDYKGTLYPLKNWEPLLTKEQFDGIQQIIERNKPKYNSGPIRHDIHLLTGIAKCVECDRGLNAGYRGGKGSTRQYKCPTTKHMSIVAEPLDQAVSQHALELLSQHDEMTVQRNDSQVLREQKRRERLNLIDAHDQWISEALEYALSPADIMKRREHHTKALQKIDAELLELDKDNLLSLFETTAKPKASARRKSKRATKRTAKRVDADQPTEIWNPFSKKMEPFNSRPEEPASTIDIAEVLAGINEELTGWNQVDIQYRRRLLETLFSKVTISRGGKGKRFTPEVINYEYTELGERLYRAWIESQLDDIDVREYL